MVDDLNVCTIILENPPTFDDYFKSIECRAHHPLSETDNYKFYFRLQF